MASVLIAGGSGLVGQRLSALLTQKGYDVAILSRSAQSESPYRVFQWDVAKGQIDKAAIQFADYVINLAGAGIADKPWTASRKQLIIDSRVQSTTLLLEAFEKNNKRPKAFLSSAAMGYYGDRGNELLDEDAAPGEGFLAESCVAWEKAIREVAASGIRTVYYRIGIVLSTQGGAFEKMKMPFNFLMGTYFGDGQQWYSWIHIDDLCNMFIAGIEHENMQGVYNAAAPTPERNKAFTKILGDTLGKPFLLIPAPAFALRLALGEMADTILSSTRLSSVGIEKAGFNFQFPELETVLKDLLNRKV